MAEIQTNQSAKQKGVKRIIKKSTRVDLTPMVDLGFLLITFFVFTTELTRPVVMKILVPKDDPSNTPVCQSCALTILLEKDNRVAYYEGIPGPGTILKYTGFTPGGIRSVLLQKKAAVAGSRGNADDMVVIIRPTSASAFRNFVDMMDEVAINGISHYFVDEPCEADKKLLKIAGPSSL